MQTATDNVGIEKTRELCQTILDQAEFQSVRRDVETFMGNNEAKGQYELLAEKGEYLHHKQHEGVSLTPEEINEYEALRTSFMANPVAKGFLNAQETMQRMQETVGQYVSKTLELGRIPTDEDFESEGGGCGSGCGCGHNH